MSMRAIMITRPGGPEVLEIGDVPAPDPGPAEVRVRVHAFGVNRADLLQRRGMYPAPPDAPPDIPGLEYAGEVDATGTDVPAVAVGDRVMGIVGGGAYAEFVTTPASHALLIPDGMTFEEAAAIPEAFLTAHDALEQVAVGAGEWVLITAVGSGVGTAAIQLVRARRAKSVGTSRTASKLERAIPLGLDAGINASSEELVASVLRVTGHGADAALDLIGGPDFGATLRALAPRGRVILIGLTAGTRAEVDLSLVLRQRLRVIGTVLRSRSTSEKTAVTRSFAEQVLPLFGTGRVAPVLSRVYSFDQVRDAHAYVESNASFGKVVVRMA